MAMSNVLFLAAMTVLGADADVAAKVAFSPDSAWIAWSDGGKVHLTSFNSSSTPGVDHILEVSDHAPVGNIVFSEDSHTLVVTFSNHAVLYTLTGTAPPLAKLKHVIQTNLTVVSAALSSNGSQWLALAVSGSDFDNAVDIYDLSVATGPSLKHSIKERPSCAGCVQLSLFSVSFSKDAKWLAVGCDLSTMRMYALEGTDSGFPELYFTFQAGDDFSWGVNSAAFSPDSHKLATTLLEGGTVVFSYHDQATPQPGGWGKKQGGVGPSSSFTAEYSPDGRWLAAGGFHQMVMDQPGYGILSVNSVDSSGQAAEKYNHELELGNYVKSVSFSQSSNWLAATSTDGFVRVYTVDATGGWIFKYSLPGPVPAPKCSDADASCPKYAKEGQCKTRPDQMHWMCQKTCGFCPQQITSTMIV